MKKSDAFLIYSASAGSGKTHTIVSLFLTQLLRNNKPENIRRMLAVTFTNKATSEMKERIIKKLQLFASETSELDKDPVFCFVKKQLRVTDRTLQTKAKLFLEFMINNYNYFNVITIDRLSHNIIRNFSSDLGLQSNFQVEIDTKEFVSLIVSRVLTKATENKQIIKLLQKHVIQKADQQASWDISPELNKLATMMFSENHMYSLEEVSKKSLSLFFEVEKNISNTVEFAKTTLKQKAKKLLQYFHKSELFDSLFPLEQTPKLIRLIANSDWNKKAGKTIEKSLETGVFIKKDSPKEKIKKFEEIRDQVVEILQSYINNWERIGALIEVRKNLTPLAVTGILAREIIEIQKEQNILHIAFFNKLINQAVSGSSTPFIYEKLGVRFKNIFIDEFQDTSKIQWSNLAPLLSFAIENEQKNNSIVIVGDAKQSIYRWRGGNPEQFISLYNHSTPFTIEPRVVRLKTNYRSAKSIVDFNNFFFRKASKFLKDPQHTKTYLEDLEQQTHSNETGYVTIKAISEKESKDEAPFLKETTKKIKDILNSGVSPNEICVLVRKNKQASMVYQELSKNNILVNSTESLLLSQSEKILFLVNLIKLRTKIFTDELKYRLIEYFLKPVENDFSWIKENLCLSIQDLLLKFSNGRFVYKKFLKLNILTGLEYALNAFEINKTPDIYLNSFFETLLGLKNKNQLTEAQFLRHWKQIKDKASIKTPANSNAVKVMTVHKAKGLEFEAVIIPFIDNDYIEGRNNKIWARVDFEETNKLGKIPLGVSKNLENFGSKIKNQYVDFESKAVLDAINLLYVATTRPSKELHLFVDKEKANKQNNLAHVFFSIYPDLMDNKKEFGNRTYLKPIKKVVKTNSYAWTFNLINGKKALYQEV